MSNSNDVVAPVTSPKKEKKQKVPTYVPPFRRGQMEQQSQAVNGNKKVDSPKTPEKVSKESPEEQTSKRPNSKAKGDKGYHVRMPKLESASGDVSPSSSTSEPADKKGRNSEPIPNCCEELEEGELKVSPVKKVEEVKQNKVATKPKPPGTTKTQKTMNSKREIHRDIEEPVKVRTVMSNRVLKETEPPKTITDTFPTSDPNTFLVQMQKSKKPEEIKKKTNIKIENDKEGFTTEQFLNISVPYFDSHCHPDFLFTQMKCKGREGMKQWVAKYPRAFPRSYIGCIANFIQPSLFVRNEDTLKDETFDLTWIEKEVTDGLYYAGTTWGCHPHYAQRWAKDESLWTALDEIFSDRRYKVVAVGECGIDLHRCESSLESQKIAFRRQIRLAFHFDLALVIHCRKGEKGDAESICLEILVEEMKKHHRYLRIHRHCYTENWPNAQKWINACPNVVFGFTPGVFQFRDDQLEAIRGIPLDRIILETDAPYFKPRPLESVSPPKTSLPGMAAAAAFKIAQIKNVPLDEVLRATHANTRRIYILQ